MADEPMQDLELTQDMLSPGFSTNISCGAPSFGLQGHNSSSSHSLTKERPRGDMESILKLFRLEQEEDVEMDRSGEEENDDGPDVDVEDQNRRTEQLRSVYSLLDRPGVAGSEFMTEVAEKFADGSRNPRWRIPMGESGILDLFLKILATKRIPLSLIIHALRLIGNSCADTDENRERVVSGGYLPPIIALLKETHLLPFVIPVLFNICVDFDPAQQEASKAQMSKALVELISSPAFSENRAFIGYICKLFDMLVVQPGEIELAPENTPAILLSLAFDPEWNCDLEDFLAFASSGIGYLRHERFQQAFIKSSAVQACFRIMLFSYTRFEDTSAHMSASMENVGPDQDDAQQLSVMRSNMNQVLSDISALPEFSATFPIQSHFTSSLRRYLSSPQIQLQVMACIMLGNIARSDAACVEFVHTSQIHKPLITILTEANDSQLLHAALGFLKNLALPMHNKVCLGEAGLIEILPRLWSMDALPQIQYSSISLARQLLNGTFENVRRICYHLSDDTDSPAYKRTRLSILVALFQRTDAEPVKMEIARLLTAICRVFTSPSQNDRDVEKRRKQFFEYHPDVGRPLGFMVSQNKWPVVRSEGWFVMALVARTPEGALCISDAMHDVKVFQPLVELLTGKSIVDGMPISPPAESPSRDAATNPIEGLIPAATPPTSTQKAEMARIDRENALVLVSELLRNHGTEMASIRRSVFEDLLRGGGLMHLTAQQVHEREILFNQKAPIVRPGQGFTVHDGTEESSNEIIIG